MTVRFYRFFFFSAFSIFFARCCFVLTDRPVCAIYVVVITMALRSPLCKAKRGHYKDMEADELLLSFFKAIIPEMKIQPHLVEDIVVGNVIAPGIAYVARASALAAGFPESTACEIVNRFCSSGLMAVSIVANNIRNNEIEVGLAVGFESMSAT